MKNLIIITLILFGLNSYGQSHDMSPGSTCKLIKTSVNTESHICPACAANDKKEKEAKNAEVKRRNDKVLADAKAKKDAEQKAYQAKLAADNAEAKRKAEAGNVLINAQNSGNLITANSINSTNGNTILISKKDNSKSKLSCKTENIDGQKWSLILNDKGEIILKSTAFSVDGNDWNNLKSEIYLNNTITDIPSNVVIAKYSSNGEYNLINSKGEKLLSDNNISGIRYCGNNFFIYFTGQKSDKFRFGENNYNIWGSQMILFDFELKIKYYYNKVGDNANCLLNERYQISKKVNNNISNSLFSFTHPVCTHIRKSERGMMIGNEETFSVGLDRKPILIGTNQSDWMPHD